MSKPLRSFITAALSASLIIAPFYTASVSASPSDANWFEKSDIALPKGTTVGQLNNALRYVLLPTSRSTETVSIRLHLAPLSLNNHDVAEKLFANSSWIVDEYKGQTVIKGDFTQTSKSFLNAAVSELASLMQSPSAQGTFSPESSSIVVAGNFKTFTAQIAIEKNFASWKPAVSEQAAYANNQNALTTQSSVSKLSYTAHAKIDNPANSKQQQKQILAVTIANKILEHRLAQALEGQNVEVEVSNQVLAQSHLIAQVSLTGLASEQLKSVQQLVQQEIDHAKVEGFKQSEYEWVVSEMRKELEQHTMRYDAAYTSHQADRLIHSIIEGRVYTSPSYELDLMNFHVAHLDKFDLNTEFDRVWQKPMEMISLPNS